jgi:hypothetical protein
MELEIDYDFIISNLSPDIIHDNLHKSIWHFHLTGQPRDFKDFRHLLDHPSDANLRNLFLKARPASSHSNLPPERPKE